MTRLAKFRALPSRERLMVLRAIATLWRVWFALHFSSFDRVRTLADRFKIAVPKPGRPTPARLAWAVTAARPLVPNGSNCLLRALAAGMLLRRYGYDSSLKIGVAKAPGGGLAAHAWLESGGQAVIGSFQLDRYVVLDTQRHAAA